MAAERLDNLRELLDGEISAAALEGEQLLNDVRIFVRRFCVLPDEHCLNAVTLWAAHAHMVKEFHTTPGLSRPLPRQDQVRLEFWKFWTCWCQTAC